jgi:hypothetical protein
VTIAMLTYATTDELLEVVFSLWSVPRLYNEGQLPSPVCKLHAAFKIAYVYDYISKLCRTQSVVNLNHVNPNVCGTGQGEAMHRKYKRLKLGGGQDYNCSTD